MIPTFNIFFSFNHPKDLLQWRSIDQILDASRENDKLFLFRNINDNFLNFEHQYNFAESSSEINHPLIQIELVDPENIFEEKFMANSLNNIIDNETVTQSEVSEIGRLKLAQSVAEGKLLDASKSGESALLRDIALAKSRIKELINDAHAAESFTILYGCGDDVSTWAGPFICSFFAAKYNYSPADGTKSIVLSFIPNGTWPALGIVPLKHGLFSRLICDSEEPLFKLDDAEPQTQNNLHFLERAQMQRLLGGSLMNTKVVPQDYHLLITRCIKTYLEHAIGKKANVLILLPDLTKVLAPSIDRHRRAVENIFPNISPQERVLFTTQQVLGELGFKITDIPFVDPEKYGGGLGGGAGVEKAVERLLFPTEYANLAQATIANAKLQLRKEADEDYITPVKRVLDNLTAISRPFTFTYAIENNRDFIRDFAKFAGAYLNREELDPKDRIVINSAYPLFIVGESILLEKYFFGKRFYEKTGLFSYSFDYSDAAATSVPTEDLLREEWYPLLNDEYLDIAKKYFLFTDKKPGCFDFTNLPKSTFAFLPEAESQLAKSNIPIFRCGVQDSNVLDLDLDLNTYYHAILRSVYFENNDLYQSIFGAYKNITETEKIKPDNLGTRANLTRLVGAYQTLPPKAKIAIKQQLKEVLYEDPAMKDLDNSKIADSLLAVLTSEDPKTISFGLDWHKDENKFVRFLNFVHTLTKLAFRGTVKTVPAFYLSNNTAGLPPVFLFYNETSILNRVNYNPISRIYNGLWRIIGFKHTISGQGAHSQFHIIKDITHENPNFAASPTPNRFDVNENPNS